MSNFEGKDNAAKVVAGFKGGMWFKNLNLPQPMKFVDAVPAEIKTKLNYSATPSLKMGKTFNDRY